ncbi:hypothetical protein N7468_000984 [Penicillium chermesinum]|uniref:ATP synthase assembly factor FMC1, mitochondrial n=1 Tax=Penicillium chermesinum TaxID=63820 RepID=A0A9W9PFR4_9EURO|nr:uncharacterized protein N7468_000984 [Penicillium chermesinum]KAJ5246001.1 hypothetical protein N7468_000984 [Penicillium chermesinum]KAJ6144298.1 hypothetical protein N7470_008193 [Penicillium chermesinum]
MAEQLTLQARSTYRALLRELPRRSLSTPSPLHQRLRQVFRSQGQTASTTAPDASQPASSAMPFSIPTTTEDLSLRIQEAEQLAKYARAQRSYCALLERYNPGMNLNDEERIRLTARRVGMDLPELYEDEGQKSPK